MKLAYGPFPYLPITHRKPIQWPNGAQLAVWVIPNIEFFHLGDQLPGSNNERVQPALAKIPNVHSWGMRDYGNRVGVWRLMDVMSRFSIRGTAALNSDICKYHPEVVTAARELNWEFMGHCQTNARRLNEVPPEHERAEIAETVDRIGEATGVKPKGWLGAGLAETWNTLDYLLDAGVEYVADWSSDDLPFRINASNGSLFSIPYSLHCNDTAQYFYQKVSAEGFGEIIRRQFDWLYAEGERLPRVMAIALHPFISGVPYRIRPVAEAFEYISSHTKVWFATGSEIIAHYATHADEEG